MALPDDLSITPAVDYAGQVKQFVDQTITDTQARVDVAFVQTLAIIDELLQLKFFISQGTPQAPTQRARVDRLESPTTLERPEIDTSGFDDTLQVGQLELPFVDVQGLDPGIIPDFNPTQTPNFNSIRKPALNLPSLPVRPIFGQVDIPERPNLATPSVGALLPVANIIPTQLNLPDFTAIAPVFLDVPPSSLNAVYTEGIYTRTILDDVVIKIRELLDGGTGLAEVAEDRIFERAVDRAVGEVTRNEQQAKRVWAEAGFSLPSGIVNAQIDQGKVTAQEGVNSANRDLTVEIERIRVENVKFAVENGINAENLLIQLYNAIQDRALDLAKFNAQQEIAGFGLLVNVFEARQRAFSTESDVYETRVRAEISKLDADRIRIESEKLKVEINAQIVDIFSTEWDAVRTQAQVYQTEVQAAREANESLRIRFGVYSDDINAYVATIQAENQKIAIFRQETETEAIKTQVLDAEARVYAAQVQGLVSRNDIIEKQIEARININDNRTREFLANLDAQKHILDIRLGKLRAEVAREQTETDAYTATQNALTAHNELEIRSVDAIARIDIAYYEAQIKEFELHITRFTEVQKVTIEAIRAAGAMASQLAAGAMAGISVGASFQGSGTTGFNQNQQFSISRSKTESTNINVDQGG